MNSPFPISILTVDGSSHAVLDSLPSSRILCCKGFQELPLTQLRAWVSPQALYFHFASYETSPPADSGFLALLFPRIEDRESCLIIELNPDSFTCTVHGAALPCLPTLSRDGGENLAGLFWGGTVRIPLSALFALNPDFKIKPGFAMGGNFFKYAVSGASPYKSSLFDDGLTVGRLIMSAY